MSRTPVYFLASSNFGLPDKRAPAGQRVRQVDGWLQVCSEACPFEEGCIRQEGDFSPYAKDGPKYPSCPLWEGARRGLGPEETLERLEELLANPGEPVKPLKRRGRKRCTATDADLIDLRRQGLTLHQIAKRVHSCTKTVSQRLRDNGIDTSRHPVENSQ